MALSDLIIKNDPNSELVWTTNNQYLIYLDTIRNDLNLKLRILEDQLSELSPSKVTAKKIKYRAKRIKDISKQIKPGNNFEKILIEDIVRNADASLAIVDFIFNPRITASTRSGKHFSIPVYLRNHFGLVLRESPYNIILRLARHIDHKSIDTYFELTHKMRSRSKDVYIKGMLSELEKKCLPRTKKVISDIGSEMLMTQEDLDFEVYLNQSDSYSYYDHANKLSLLDPNEIICYKEGNEEKIFEGNLLLEGTHERIHNLFDNLSQRSFPNLIGLSPFEESYNNLHIGLPEGIARRTERFSLLFFFKKNQEEFGLSDNDLKIMEYSSKFDLIRRTNQTTYSIFHVMQYTDSIKDFNAYERLSKITKLPIFKRDPDILNDESLLDSMYNIATLLGSYYVKRCIQEINSKYGFETVDNNIGLILRGFLTGNWQFQSHYKFLNSEYLPRAEKFFK